MGEVYGTQTGFSGLLVYWFARYGACVSSRNQKTSKPVNLTLSRDNSLHLPLNIPSLVRRPPTLGMELFPLHRPLCQGVYQYQICRFASGYAGFAKGENAVGLREAEA